MSRSKEPVRPRNGHTLVVGVVARISGCTNQKELSLEDQEDHARQVVAEKYGGPADYRVVATTGEDVGPHDLLDEADRAMYRVKAGQRADRRGA